MWGITPIIYQKSGLILELIHTLNTWQDVARTTAANDTDTVASWGSTVNGFFATQATAANEPTRSDANGMVFDGTNDSLTVPDDNKFDLGAGNFTVEFWLKTAKITRYDIFGRQVNTSTTPTLYMFWNGATSLIMYPGGTTYTGTNNMSDNTWHHWAMVRSGTNSCALYRDGTSIHTWTSSATLNDTAALGIGFDRAANNFFVNGTINNFRIWGYARWTAAFTPPVRT